MNKLLLVILISGLLTACGSDPKKDKSSATEERSQASESEGAQSYGAGTRSTTGLEALNDPNSPLSVRVIYFEYDSSEIGAEFRGVIEAHAAFLAANPNITVSLEGHADERGSREYNLALGERRALTVKRQMTVLGTAPSQLRTVSYGEERPVIDGHDERSWSQNRRVEIIY